MQEPTLAVKWRSSGAQVAVERPALPRRQVAAYNAPMGAGAGQDRPLGEAGLVFGAIAALTLALDALTPRLGLGEQLHLLVGGLFLLAAVQLAQRQPDGIARYGLGLGGLLEPAQPELPPGPWGAVVDLARALGRALPAALRETGVALGAAALVFPPFVVAFRFWHQPTGSFDWLPPEEPLGYLLGQLLVVGLPEEALFRGYFQGRLGDAWPRQRRLLGATLSPPAWLGQAALFALLHFAVDRNPVRLAVFFPGLAFGWLRAWRGGIGAAIVFHALSNLLSDVLVRGWL
jgi:membrane protease YdiL (CAAX protease family)